MRRRLVVAALAGAALLAGVLAAVTGSDALSIVAGVLAVVSAGVMLWVLGSLDAPASAGEPTVVFDDDADGEPVVDSDTGLYAPAFLGATLDGRVATARRVLRPLSLVLFEVSEPADDGATQPLDPAIIAATMRATLRESDLACRAAERVYAMILEDTAEDGAVWTAERVRRNLAAGGRPRLFRAGVAAYPNHGLDAASLHDRAEKALALARDWRRDRIEVADPV